MPVYRRVGLSFALAISVATYASSAASQLAQSYETIVLDNLIVCSELDGITKSSLRDFYFRRTRESFLSFLTAPRPMPVAPSLPGVFVASNGQLGQELQDCLVANSTNRLNLLETTRQALTSLAEPLPAEANPHGIKFGPKIVGWSYKLHVNQPVITYVRWDYDADDGPAVFEDFFERLE